MTDRLLSQSLSLPALIAANVLSPKMPSAILAREGDSRTQHSILVSSTQSIKYIDGLDFWIEALSKGRVDCPSTLNFGVTGNTSTQILARLPASLATAKTAGAAAMIIFGATTNDRASGMSSSDSIANLTAMQTLVLAAGLALIWVGETPRGSTNFSGQALVAATTLRDHMAVEYWLAAQANVRHVYVARPWAAIGDVSSVANSQAGYVADASTYDGLHPNTIGAYRVVKYSGLLDIIDAIWPPHNRLAPSAADAVSAGFANGAINANPLLIGSGGTAGTGATGTIPAPWTLRNSPGTGSTAALAASAVTGADGTPGLQVVLSGTSGSTMDLVQLLQDVTAGTFLASGMSVRASCRLQIAAGQVGINAAYLGVAPGISGTVGGDMLQSGMSHRATDAFPNEAMDLVVRTDSFVLPANLTSIRVWLKLQLLLSTALSATLTVGQIAVRPA